MKNIFCFFLIILAATLFCYSEEKAARITQHDFVLVMAEKEQAGALALAGDSIIRALAEAKILPEGYPKYGRPAIPAVKKIILDEKGSGINLFLADYPDSRAYLYEIYLEKEFPGDELEITGGENISRVAVNFPLLKKEYAHNLFGLIETGLKKAGARPVKIFRFSGNLPESVKKAVVQIRKIIEKVPGTAIQSGDCVFMDEIAGLERTGFEILVEGSFKSLDEGTAPAELLRSALVQNDWRELPDYSADGPDGTAFALFKDDVICIVRGEWDGGAADDPTYIPSEFYKILIRCAEYDGK